MLKEAGEVGWRGSGLWLVRQFKCSLVSVAERRRKIRVRRVEIILGLEQQELGLGKIHVRKAQIETRFDFVFFELAYLVGDELAIFDGFLGDSQYRLRP